MFTKKENERRKIRENEGGEQRNIERIKKKKMRFIISLSLKYTSANVPTQSHEHKHIIKKKYLLALSRLCILGRLE